MRRLMLSAVLLCVPFVIGAQDPNDPNAKPKPKPDPKKEAEFVKKVNAAIDKGVAHLLNQFKVGPIGSDKAELVLLALFHGGVKRDHPFIVANMNSLLSKGITATYNVGLRGLLLEKVDRARYQQALADVARWLVEGQGADGQWTYGGVGKVGPVPGGYAAPSKKKGPPKPGETTVEDAEGPRPGKPLKFPFKLGHGGGGDNSNSQYAVLGLFAAARANVEIPKEVLERTEKWFEACQCDDGGWGYGAAESSYGSMTAAGLTGLIVTKFYLGKDWKKDPKVQKGLAWLGKNLKYDCNPKAEGIFAGFHYYWIYGVERVGAITDLKEFGGHDWYREGAEYLISHQMADGRWGDALDTSYAILFLRKATPPLQKPADVATGGGPKQDEKKDDEKKTDEKKEDVKKEDEKKDEGKKDEPAK